MVGAAHTAAEPEQAPLLLLLLQALQCSGRGLGHKRRQLFHS